MSNRVAWRHALIAAVAVGGLVALWTATRPRTAALVIHNASPRPVWIEVGEVRQALGGRGTVRLPTVPAGVVVLGSRGLYEEPDALATRVADLPAARSRVPTYVWRVGEGALWVVRRTYGGDAGLAGRRVDADLFALPPGWGDTIDEGFPDQVRARKGATVTRLRVFSEDRLRARGALRDLAPLPPDPTFDRARADTERRVVLEPLAAGLLVGLIALVAVRFAPLGSAFARGIRARTDLTRSRDQRLVAALLIALFTGLNVVGAWDKSRTYDEGAHLAYGAQVLSGDATRRHGSVVPITALNALPGRIGTAAPAGGLRTALLSDRAARLPTIGVGGLLCGVVFLWARALYGFAAGLLALLLIGFAPNVQGHARWAATDVYGAASVLCACWCAWRYARRPGLGRALLLGLALGVALVAKLMGILLYPALALVFGARWVSTRERPPRWLVHAAVVLVVHLLVLNAAYLFQGTGAALDDYALESRTLTSWRARLGPLARVPLPLPRPYLEGVDESKTNVETSVKGRSNNYLLGEVRQSRFPAYYPIAFAIKVPLVAQALFWLALIALARRRSRVSLVEREVFLLAPILVFGGFVTLFSAVQIGIRHLLVVLPLGHVLIGSLVQDWGAWGRRARIALGLALLWLAASVLSWFPHTMSYFNELILDRKRASDVLADSNLDWGQNQRYVRRYLEANPDVVPDPAAPIAGRVLLSVNRLCGVFVDDRLDWHRRLRTTLEPIDHVGYTHLVYRIPPDRVDELRGE